jgi:hypothetical protein
MGVASDPTLAADVRARLEEGVPESEARRLRRRVVADGAIAVLPLGLGWLADQYSTPLRQGVAVSVLALVVASVTVAYWRSGPRPARAVADGEVAEALRHSRRCSECGRVVLPREHDRCLLCGTITNPRLAMAVAVGTVVFLMAAVLWQNGLLW